MRTLRTGSAVALLVLAIGSGVASAGHNGHAYSSSRACMDSGTVFRMATCTRRADGMWIARYGPDGTRPGPGSGFGSLLAVALLWSAAPAIASGVIASQRSQSVGLAVLLGIILGWIGLLIVALTFKQEVVVAGRNFLENASRPPPQVSTRPRDIESRLEDLDRLKVRGLITEEEYASRRQHILEDL